MWAHPAQRKFNVLNFSSMRSVRKKRHFVLYDFFCFGRKPCMCKRVMLFFLVKIRIKKESKQAGKLFCGLGFKEPTRRAKNELSCY